jgi:hypothetical protein
MILLFSTSGVLAWLPQSDVRIGPHDDTGDWSSSPRLLSWHGCPNQIWATGIMKELLFATSGVLAWLLQSDVSNRCHEDTGEWSSSPRLLSRHGFPYQTWDTRTNGHLLCFNGWTFTEITLRSCVMDSLFFSKDCILPLNIFQVLFYLNMVETEHYTFFRECIVNFNHSTITADM